MVGLGSFFFGVPRVYPHQIQQSLKLGGASYWYTTEMYNNNEDHLLGRRHYLAKTYESASTSTACTIATWWKPYQDRIGYLGGGTHNIFQAYTSGTWSGSVEDTTFASLYFTARENNVPVIGQNPALARQFFVTGGNDAYSTGGGSLELIAVTNGDCVIRRTVQDFVIDTNWMHIVCRMDTTNGTFNIYINGEDQALRTDNGGSNWTSLVECPSDSTSLAFGQNCIHYIGGNTTKANGSPPRKFAYQDQSIGLADFHFIDGQALEPKHFGRRNEYGLWVPKDTSNINFGANGCRLDFSDKNNIGNDISGNGNHYNADLAIGQVTPTTLETGYPAGVHNYSKDSPTNTFCILDNPGNTNNFSDFYNHVETGSILGTSLWSSDNEDLRISRFSNWLLRSGKWYVEFHSPSWVEHAVIGIQRATNYIFGQSINANVTGFGRGTLAFYNGSGGSGANNGQYIESVDTSIATALAGSGISNFSDVVALKIDLESNTKSVELVKCNADNTFTSIQSLNISNDLLNYDFNEGVPFRIFITGKFIYEDVGNSWDNTAHANFGQDSTFNGFKPSGSHNATDENGHGNFHNTPPSGFLAMCSSNAPNPSIAIDEGRINSFKSHFDVIRYSVPAQATLGNGETLNITKQSKIKPDFVMLKDLSSSGGIKFWDSSRGANKMLSTDEDAVESTNDADGYISSFNDGGFTLTGGSNSADNVYNSHNSNINNYVAMCWKANGGVTTTNDASETGIGTLDSTYQANTDAGFSIVTFNRNGGGLVAHGLGKKPAFILMKSLTADSSTAWGSDQPVTVFHKYSAFDWDAYNGGTDTTTYNYNGNWKHDSIGPEEVIMSFSSDATGAELDRKTISNTDIRLGAWKDSDGGTDDPTSTTFSVTDKQGTISSSVNAVAYCWAEIPGYSAFTGLYAANFANIGNYLFVPLGFRPKFVIMKPMFGQEKWSMFTDEISESTNNFSTKFHHYISTPFNQSTDNVGTTTTTGFQLSSGVSTFPTTVQFKHDGIYMHGAPDPSPSNGTTGYYIVCAWADIPFKYASGF